MIVFKLNTLQSQAAIRWHCLELLHSTVLHSGNNKFLSFITFLDTSCFLSTLPCAQEQGVKWNLYVQFSVLIKSEDLTAKLKILQCCHEMMFILEILDCIFVWRERTRYSVFINKTRTYSLGFYCFGHFFRQSLF